MTEIVWPYVHTLAKPMEIKGKDGVVNTYTSFTLREPKAGDLMVMDRASGDMAKVFALVAQITSTPVTVLHELPVAEFQGMARVVTDFLAPSEG